MGNKQTYLILAPEGNETSSQGYLLSKHLLKDSPLQIKSIMRYHPTPMRMATIKKTKKEKIIGEDVNKWNPYALLVGQ